MRVIPHPCGIVGVLLAALSIGASQPACASLFECLDPAGIIVITDSPAQLVMCRTLVDQTATDAHASDPAPAVSGPASTRSSSRDVPPAQVPTDSAQRLMVTIPLQRIGSLFIVTLTLNHTRDARLILDTGASHTILSRRIARDLDLDGHTHMAPVTMHTVGGPVRGDIVPIESMRIAQAEVRDTVAAIYDLPDAPAGVEGLLGLSFLRHFLVTVDTAHDQLVLTRVTP